MRSNKTHRTSKKRSVAISRSSFWFYVVWGPASHRNMKSHHPSTRWHGPLCFTLLTPVLNGRKHKWSKTKPLRNDQTWANNRLGWSTSSCKCSSGFQCNAQICSEENGVLMFAIILRSVKLPLDFFFGMHSPKVESQNIHHLTWGCPSLYGLLYRARKGNKIRWYSLKGMVMQQQGQKYRSNQHHGQTAQSVQWNVTQTCKETGCSCKLPRFMRAWKACYDVAVRGGHTGV